MAKSKRSKVKMAYKAMRRSVMEPKHDAKLRAQASTVYSAIGLPMPEERAESERMTPRTHGGGELVSTFAPTPKGPTLNVVHGPKAAQDACLRLTAPVVGFPIVGAGARARMRAEIPRKNSMEVDEEYEALQERPYFYPTRARKSGAIRKSADRNRKGKRQGARHPQNKRGVQFV